MVTPLDVDTAISLGLAETGGGLVGDSFDWLAASAASVAGAVTVAAGWVWPEAAVLSPLLYD
jgi:hypothetical protein